MLLITLFVLAQSPLAPASAFGEAQPPRTLHGECGILVSSPQQPGRTRDPYSATRILDLRLAVQMRSRLSGRHVLELKVFTPHGHLYQTLTAPFTSTTPRVRWDGPPGPATEQVPQVVGHGAGRRYEVAATLPVGGTAIVSNSLYGRWRVLAYLDGSAEPCGSGAGFEIGP
jgi:hypothetical protein